MEKKWVVFDGPVDAIWIENMNTVLDDNCTLCLPNGERIKLNPITMRMLFEVQDLAVASPATVSRCGMVYMPPNELGWLPYVTTWANTQLPEGMTDETKAYILSLFNKTIDAGCPLFARTSRRPSPPWTSTSSRLSPRSSSPWCSPTRGWTSPTTSSASTQSWRRFSSFPTSGPWAVTSRRGSTPSLTSGPARTLPITSRSSRRCRPRMRVPCCTTSTS